MAGARPRKLLSLEIPSNKPGCRSKSQDQVHGHRRWSGRPTLEANHGGRHRAKRSCEGVQIFWRKLTGYHRRSPKTTSTSRTRSRQDVEARVLSGLKNYLLDADLVGEFLEAYQNELREAREQASRSVRQREKRLAELNRKIERLVDAIVDGTSTASTKERLIKLEQEKTDIVTLDEAPNQEVIHLPSLHRLYKERVQALMAGLSSPVIRSEADLPPEAPSFITRVCGFGFHILHRQFGQARRARRPQIAQALAALQQVFGFRAMSAA